MRCLLQLAAVALLPTLAPGGFAQLPWKHDKPQTEDLSWMWQYTQPAPGSRENALLWDPHFKPFLQKYLTAPQSFWDKNKPLSDVAIEFLAVPGHVIGDDNRYFNADGCVQHFCPNRGLLWVDLGIARPLVVFAAIDWISDNRTTDDSAATYTMWVFSNRSLDPAHLPAALTRSIARWTSQPLADKKTFQNVTRVFLIDPDGTPHPINPSTIGARNTLPPETTTEPNQSLSNTTPKAKP
ncbi:hypothetical protein [Edaphobacter albus]|uniref:hypothetical protein n=1 Tax=Edaphobacter sp. 4G125 TaxID=2763071 RepID=UPI0016454949|nr:hypothetical protein [Edaphobacter sp. 4G125]QNI36301.1 hypothetical protein H7846_15165 [Edaphobacter sp. 4G125]